MAGEIVRRQVRFLAAVVLISLLMGVSSAIVVAQEGEAVPEIPTAAVDVEGLVEEIVREAGGIEDSGERFRELSYVLYNLRAATPEQRQPVIEALEETAREVDDPQTRFSPRESLVLYAPELAVRIALRLGETRLRDSYLRDVIPQLAVDQPERARELIEEITEPADRAQAIVKYAKVAPASYAQIQPLLQEAATLEWEDTFNTRLPTFVEPLSRFAGKNPVEVTSFLRKNFEPHDAIWLLSRIAWILSNQRDAPEAARILIDEAEELISQSDEPFESAIDVLGGGNEIFSKAESKELFDTHIWNEVLRGQQRSERPLAIAARFGMSQMFSYSRELANLRDWPLTDVLPGAVGRVANGSNPGRIMDWLELQPPSRLRALCVVEVASALKHDFHPTARDRHDVGRQWLATLTQLASEIDDDQMRWRVYDSLVTLSKNINEPSEDLRQKWWTLRLRFDRETPGDWERVSPFEFWKFPLEEQKRRLEDQLDPDPNNSEYWRREQHGPSPTLRRIRESSLSNADKERLYRRMIPQADIDPLAVAQIAGALAEYDYAEALDLIWWILPSERDSKHGLGMCPYPEAPRNARMALQMLSGGRRHYLEGDEVIDALWAFANRALDKDRDVVLEELAGVLTEQGDLGKALSVARRIEDVTARTRCLGTIVAVASGATQEG